MMRDSRWSMGQEESILAVAVVDEVVVVVKMNRKNETKIRAVFTFTQTCCCRPKPDEDWGSSKPSMIHPGQVGTW